MGAVTLTCQAIEHNTFLIENIFPAFNVSKA
ncbi:uncharacterized protein METZ01_LOCUS197326 [marine metagenome]|uniref:Uncharacterized protein n=1 Tax=marine metagenome TaxID=408172 RepID=A0A382E280_9ZZZZ